MRRRFVSTVDVTVSVDVHDVLSEMDEEDFAELCRKTIGCTFDAKDLDRVHWHLIRNEVQPALAIIESHLNFSRVTDQQRAQQFEQLSTSAH